MSTGNNIETEYLELNEKQQQWAQYYQVFPINFPFFLCMHVRERKRVLFKNGDELKGQSS